MNHQAIQLLSEQIGVVDTFRFVNQFTTGHGNYTEERDAFFGLLTLDEIVSAIENKRPSQLPNKALNTTENKPASCRPPAAEGS